MKQYVYGFIAFVLCFFCLVSCKSQKLLENTGNFTGHGQKIDFSATADESVGSEVWCDIHESFRKTSPEHVLLYRCMPAYTAGRNRSSITSHQLRDRTVARILCRSLNSLKTNINQNYI